MVAALALCARRQGGVAQGELAPVSAHDFTFVLIWDLDWHLQMVGSMGSRVCRPWIGALQDLLVVVIALHGRRVYTHRELRRVCTDVVRDMYEHLEEIGRIVCGDATMDLVAVCAQLSYARVF